MATLRIYDDIVGAEEKVMLQSCYGMDGICYKDIDEFLSLVPADDKQIDLRIDCKGGDCITGWAIYDKLRQSGKEIYATIEGECSSIATIILLAAPKERRVAYKNAHICIHNPAVQWCNITTDERITADTLNKNINQLSIQKKELENEQKRILDLYVERTGSNYEELQELMNRDTYIGTDEAIRLGFISSTLLPTTDIKKSILNSKEKGKMSTKLVSVEQGYFKRLLAKAGFSKASRMVAQVVTAVDGREFTVEREDGDPQVGDSAAPNGEYILEDGTKVVVDGGKITEIVPETEENAEESPKTENPEEAKAESKAEESVEDKAEPVVEDKAEPAVEDKAEPVEDKAEESVEDKAEESVEDKAETKDEAVESEEEMTDETEEGIEERVSGLEKKIDSLTEKLDTIATTLETLVTEKENVEKQNEELSEEVQAKKNAVILDEGEKSILEEVNKYGGKEWLDKVVNSKSTFNISNRRYVENTSVERESPTRVAIREQKERAEAKRNARKK